MYFRRPQVVKGMGNLHHALVEGGWLAVSPSEASKALFPQFTAVNFPGAILFQKSAAARGTGPVPTAPEPIAVFAAATFAETLPVPPAAAAEASPPEQREPVASGALSGGLTVAESLYREARYAEAADTRLATNAGHTSEPATSSLSARQLA